MVFYLVTLPHGSRLNQPVCGWRDGTRQGIKASNLEILCIFLRGISHSPFLVGGDSQGQRELTDRGKPPPPGWAGILWVRSFPLTPLHSGRAGQAGMLHLAGVNLSTLRNRLQHHQGLEGPVSILDQACGHDPSLLLLAIPEPSDFNLAGVEASHRADQEVVVLLGLCLCWVHSHLGLS